jgi:hypothetical protein
MHRADVNDSRRLPRDFVRDSNGGEVCLIVNFQAFLPVAYNGHQ